MELFLTLILAMSQPAVVGPSGIELERMIDNSVQLPGTTADILFDGVAPVPCGDGVLFYAVENDQFARRGAYFVSSTELKVIVDEATLVPGSGVTFQRISRMTCVGTSFVFLGSAGASSFAGVYRWNPGGEILLLLADGVHIHGREVESILEVSANSVGLGMRGRLPFTDPGEALIVKYYDEEPFIVVDSSAVLPGQSEPVTIYSLPFLVGKDLFFRARTFLDVGLYRWSAGKGISVVADPQTPVPSLGGRFFNIGLMTLLNEGLVFDGTSTAGQGLFLFRDGQIQPMVLPGDVTEEGETIRAAFDPSGAGELLSFTATTEENRFFPAVFVRTRDGKLRRILGAGDTVEGQRVGLVNSRAHHSSVAIRVNTNSSPSVNVIYRATFAPGVSAGVPALSEVGAVVLTLGLMLAGLYLHRRRV